MTSTAQPPALDVVGQDPLQLVGTRGGDLGRARRAHVDVAAGEQAPEPGDAAVGHPSCAEPWCQSHRSRQDHRTVRAVPGRPQDWTRLRLGELAVEAADQPTVVPVGIALVLPNRRVLAVAHTRGAPRVRHPTGRHPYLTCTNTRRSPGHRRSPERLCVYVPRPRFARPALALAPPAPRGPGPAVRRAPGRGATGLRWPVTAGRGFRRVGVERRSRRPYRGVQPQRRSSILRLDLGSDRRWCRGLGAPTPGPLGFPGSDPAPRVIRIGSDTPGSSAAITQAITQRRPPVRCPDRPGRPQSPLGRRRRSRPGTGRGTGSGPRREPTAARSRAGRWCGLAQLTGCAGVQQFHAGLVVGAETDPQRAHGALVGTDDVGLGRCTMITTRNPALAPSASSRPIAARTSLPTCLS
ncbi:hypothetical protein Ae707Ps1_6251c [Pseudonocardia sp. Ae707_Ps1]|nr:hypothetical protein Ae707Ps1_6251c [Pseudonocardia sp. Ae707_Ps1]